MNWDDYHALTARSATKKRYIYPLPRSAKAYPVSDPLPWRECTQTMINLGRVEDRFEWPGFGGNYGGFNCSEGVTLTDITGSISWCVSYLGDLALTDTAVGAFFEVGQPVIGHTFSLVTGWLVLVAAFHIWAFSSDVTRAPRA